MPSDRFSKLKPPAIISTIASLPRRFGEAFVPAPTADPDEVAALVGDDGRTMLDIVATATAEVKLLHEAISRVADTDNPEVSASAVDAAQRPVSSASGSRTAELAALEAATDSLTTTLNGYSGTEWGRNAQVAGGGSISLEELGQEAARAGIAQLAKAEALAKTF